MKQKIKFCAAKNERTQEVNAGMAARSDGRPQDAVRKGGHPQD